MNMKKLLAWILAAAMLIGAAALVVTSGAKSETRSVSSPEMFSRSVGNGVGRELSAAKRLQEEKAQAEETDLFVGADVVVNVGLDVLDKEVLEMLQSAAGIDLSWLQSIGLHIDYGREGALNGVNLGALLNGTEFMDAKFVMDTESGKAFLQIPALGAKFMEIPLDLSEIDLNNVGGKPEFLNDPEAVEEMLQRYLEIVLENVEETEAGEETLELANGKSVDCTVHEIKLDGETIIKLTDALLTEAKDDENMKELVLFGLQNSNNADVDADDLRENWEARIDELLEEVRDTKSEDITFCVELRSFVDEDEEVRGLEMKAYDDEELVFSFGFKTVREDEELFFEGDCFFYDENEGENVRLMAAGSFVADEDKESVKGGFDLSVKTWDEDEEEAETLELARVDLEVEKKDDTSRFQMDIVPAEELMDKLLEDADLGDVLEKQIRKLSLRVSGEVTEDEGGELKLSLRSKDKDVLSLALNAAPIDAFEIVLPTDAVDADAWSQSMDMNGLSDVVSKLIEAGLPASLLESFGNMMSANA